MSEFANGGALAAMAETGVVPVINIPRPELAAPLARALCEGGIPLIEVTLRNDTALESLRRIRREVPQMRVAAGTVLTCEQADAALEAGAELLVTPGFNPRVVRHCLDAGASVLPGCVTPTEIEAGREMGLRVFKFFPAEQLGGVKTIRELCGPYRDVRFVATSGITFKNIPEYLSSPHVAAVGGSCMAPAALVQAEDWAGISALCREAMRAALGFRIMHVGVNHATAAEGEASARRLACIFDLPYAQGGRSDFAGTAVECCKQPFPGANGHIAIGTFSVERAVACLRRRGVRFREEFKNVAANGELIAGYLEEEIGGFAIHLLKCDR